MVLKVVLPFLEYTCLGSGQQVSPGKSGHDPQLHPSEWVKSEDTHSSADSSYAHSKTSKASSVLNQSWLSQNAKLTDGKAEEMRQASTPLCSDPGRTSVLTCAYVVIIITFHMGGRQA